MSTDATLQLILTELIKINVRLDKIEARLDDHVKKFDLIFSMLEDHTQKLDLLTSIAADHTHKLDLLLSYSGHSNTTPIRKTSGISPKLPIAAKD